MTGRTVVALSGGVDSAVAAALTVEAGAEAIGMTLRLYDAPAQPTTRRRGSCCRSHDDSRVAGGHAQNFHEN